MRIKKVKVTTEKKIAMVYEKKAKSGAWDEYSRPVERGIDWVVCGAESGPKRRPANIEWIRSLRDQCQSSAVPFFLKQMDVDGKLVKMPELDGKTWGEMPC